MQRARVNVMDLAPLLNKKVRVKFAGGREFCGLLRGYDELVNLVLDDAVEYMRDPADPQTVTETTRYVGLVVARGPVVTVVSPEDGFKEIENPFLGEAEE